MDNLRKGILRKEPHIYELSCQGRTGYSLPVEEKPQNIPSSILRDQKLELPSLSEVEVVRHFTMLSHWNHCIELGSYPLGSCTMKYNPKINEYTARLSGFSSTHPLQDEEDMQGALELMYELQTELENLSGFSKVTLQPSAGANGEFTGLSIIKKAIEAKGEEKRVNILIPDTAHGTNPASVVLNGFKPVSIITGEEGHLLCDAVKPYLNDELAGIMVTNPNTLGIYESELKEISSMIHDAGGYVYMDGANFNAIMGKVKPGLIGIDTMHFNLHKTFATPHGGGGPGAGPVGVIKEFEQYLPTPVIEKSTDGKFYLKTEENSIGKLHPFFGNYGVLVRALTYIKELGESGLYDVTEKAVLNARYLRKKLETVLQLSYEAETLHEAVFTDNNLKKETGVTTMDLAKRLLDYGVHPPTVYFPLLVKGSFMVEPTETDSKRDMDYFYDVMKEIVEDAKTSPEKIKTAPHNTGIRRLDETYAARKKILRWLKEEK
jgi:glycine cleavage system P protein (glycine dehydrogenase) subunit 2